MVLPIPSPTPSISAIQGLKHNSNGMLNHPSPIFQASITVLRPAGVQYRTANLIIEIVNLNFWIKINRDIETRHRASTRIIDYIRALTIGLETSSRYHLTQRQRQVKTETGSMDHSSTREPTSTTNRCHCIQRGQQLSLPWASQGRSPNV